ncbi:MAG: response regulator, partial [Paracoccus sp. (in: a-proteobacteria)]|uniref:response regulator n=1 Tax=Paracoccus sp. TaxID=267 RepID=UPI00405931A4
MPDRPIRFLIVDDIVENIVALEALLRRDGLVVDHARSASEALELMLLHDYALAFLDVQMPGTDGYELAELMRSTERTRGVPIIFVTAAEMDEARRVRGDGAGAVAYHLKPKAPVHQKSQAAGLLPRGRP